MVSSAPQITCTPVISRNKKIQTRFFIIIIYACFYAYILARIHLRMIRLCTRISRPKRYRISIPRVALESRFSRQCYLATTTSRGCPEWSVLDETSLYTRMCTCVHYFVRHAFRGSNFSVFSIRKIRCDRDATYIIIEPLFSIGDDYVRSYFTYIETMSQISEFRSNDAFLVRLTIRSRSDS